MATTQTYTKTYARSELFTGNITAALLAYGWPPELISQLVDVGLAEENRYISEFHTYGFVPNTNRWQLHSWISIDWDEHGRLLVSNATVSVDDRWVDGENPGLIGQADKFGELISRLGLRPEYAWYYTPSLYANPEEKRAAKVHMRLESRTLECEPDGVIEDSQANRVAGLEEITYGSESAFPD